MVKNRIDVLEDFRKQLEGADVDLLREMVKIFAEQLMVAEFISRRIEERRAEAGDCLVLWQPRPDRGRTGAGPSRPGRGPG